jgi:Family of unknown function (DUF6279)
MSFFKRSPRHPFQWLNIIGGLLALLLTLTLVGCSTAKLAYNNAPSLAYWWLDGYLDFDEPQSNMMRADLDTLQAWHRRTELPLIAGTLEKLQRMAPANVTPEQICEVSDGLRGRLRAVVDQAAPTMVALAPTLKPAQFTHLARQFDKHNQKWRTDWLDVKPDEYRAKRLKQLTERMDMFYGRLDEPQLALLRNHVASSGYDPKVQSRETLRRQQDALDTLRSAPANASNPVRLNADARALLARTLESPDASYRQYSEKMILENCRVLAAVHNSTTTAQRRKLQDSLRDYEMDARTLMATGR